MMKDKLLKMLNEMLSAVESPKALSIVLVIVSVLVMILCLNSCGLTKAVVKHNSPSQQTKISITTSNPTTVDTSPNVQINSLRDSSKTRKSTILNN